MLGERGREVGDALGIDVRQARARARRERERACQTDRLGLLGDEILHRQVAEQLHAVASPALGRGERTTGAVDETLHGAQRVAGPHRADRDGHGQQDVVADRDGQRPDEPAELLGEPSQHLVAGHGGREHDELLAAPAADHVVAAQPALQARGDLAQHAVADGVPVDVVDAPEVVEVEHHHARRHAGALAARELGGDRVEHVPAVVEAGQRIGARAPLGLGAAALGLEQGPLLVAAPLAQRDDADDCESERDREQREHARREPGGGHERRLRAACHDDPAEAAGDAGERAIGEPEAACRHLALVEPGRRELAIGGLRRRAAGEHAARGVEDLAPARAVDDRDLDRALGAERGSGGRPHARERELEAHDPERRAAVVAHERRVRDDPLARVGRAVRLRDVDAAGLRPERRAEERLVADVARERRGRRGRAAHDAGVLAAVESDRGGRPGESGLSALERSQRAVDARQRLRTLARDARAQRRVPGHQAQAQARAPEEPGDGTRLAIGLQREALIQAGADVGALGDRQGDADEREQQARDQGDGGGVAHTEGRALGCPSKHGCFGVAIPPSPEGTRGGAGNAARALHHARHQIATTR